MESNEETITHDETPLSLADAVYQLGWRWSDFELSILTPEVRAFSKPKRIMPALLPNTDKTEFVYPIVDYGNRFLTSKQEEMFVSGLSMCKMHYTIEKIISLLILRLTKNEEGDEGEEGEAITNETEVLVAFGGHELAQRKAFESVINLDYNVVITNFEPGEWGERYLRIVKNLADKGYGYPSKAPRDLYRHLPGLSGAKVKSSR